GLILPQSDAACDFDSSSFTGTFANIGSALFARRSEYASFLASTIRCQYCGSAGPRSASVAPSFGTHTSRMFSISSAANPCPGGGDARRALERFLEADGPEALQQRVIARNRAGHRRGVHAVLRHAVDRERRPEELRRPAARRPAAGVERIQLLVLRRPDDREE